MPKPVFNPVGDVISGLIMAATSIPQLIAYAETVGYASYRGLATAGPPLLAWGLSTGHPYMNAGVTSITALMAKSDLEGESFVQEQGEQAYVELVAAYSMYVGIASVLLALIGFGKLAKLVPKPVRSGFKWGCAIGVLVSALPNGLLNGGSKELKQIISETPLAPLLAPYKASLPGLSNVSNVLYALTHPTVCWAMAPTVLFVLGTIFVMEGKKYLPRFLPPGTEVILVTAVATLYSLNMDYTGGIVGEIPALDPNAGFEFFGGVRIPVEFIDYQKLLDAPVVERFGGSWLLLAVSASIFAGVNFLSIMGIASGFESEDGIAWNAERELVAQGVSCGMAAWVGSAPVSGSMSRSLVSRITGTTSQLACIVTALCWIYLQPLLGKIMPATPKAALSAIIVSAVLKGVLYPKDLLAQSGLDALIAWATGIVTALTNPTQGFAFGLAFYLLLSVVRSSPKEKQA